MPFLPISTRLPFDENREDLFGSIRLNRGSQFFVWTFCIPLICAYNNSSLMLTQSSKHFFSRVYQNILWCQTFFGSCLRYDSKNATDMGEIGVRWCIVFPWRARTIRFCQSGDIRTKRFIEPSIGFFIRILTNCCLACLKIVGNHSLEKKCSSEQSFMNFDVFCKTGNTAWLRRWGACGICCSHCQSHMQSDGTHYPTISKNSSIARSMLMLGPLSFVSTSCRYFGEHWYDKKPQS